MNVRDIRNDGQHGGGVDKVLQGVGFLNNLSRWESADDTATEPWLDDVVVHHLSKN